MKKCVHLDLIGASLLKSCTAAIVDRKRQLSTTSFLLQYPSRRRVISRNRRATLCRMRQHRFNGSTLIVTNSTETERAASRSTTTPLCEVSRPLHLIYVVFTTSKSGRNKIEENLKNYRKLNLKKEIGGFLWGH